MKLDSIEVGKMYVCGPPHSTEQRMTVRVVSDEPHFAVLNAKDKELGKPLTKMESEGVVDGTNETLFEGVLVEVVDSTWPLYADFVGERAVVRPRFVKALAE